MTNDKWDDVAKEADLLRGAIITGTLKADHVEPHARPCGCPANAVTIHNRRRNSRALDEALGVSKYPDVATTYPPVVLREGQTDPTDDEKRDAANALVAAGYPIDVAARLIGITPRSPQ